MSLTPPPNAPNPKPNPQTKPQRLFELPEVPDLKYSLVLIHRLQAPYVNSIVAHLFTQPCLLCHIHKLPYYMFAT
jgi:hypothetical protein